MGRSSKPIKYGSSYNDTLASARVIASFANTINIMSRCSPNTKDGWLILPAERYQVAHILLPKDRIGVAISGMPGSERFLERFSRKK